MSTTSPTAVSEPAQKRLDFLKIEEVDEQLADALVMAGYDSVEEIADAEFGVLSSQINDALIDSAQSVDFREKVQGVSETLNTQFHDAGIETIPELALLDPEAFAAEHNASPGRVRVAQESAAQMANVVSMEGAKKIIASAESNRPVGPRLLGAGISRYDQRADSSGSPTARIHPVDTESGGVGKPRIQTADSLSLDDADAQYVSEFGPNDGSPVLTGLPIHEDTGYEQIPRLETDPEAREHSLPADEDGVLPPAIPSAKFAQRPLDELIAKKLAMNEAVRIVGPPGVGKNLFWKYLAYEVNVGYRSIDVDETTTPDDLFGPLTPNEDGVVLARNGPIKQGLLNGDFVVINEFPAMQAGVAMSLHRVLNEGTLLIKSHGELVEPHPSARLIITMNPPGETQNRGSEAMAKPTRERFATFWWGYPDKQDEIKTMYQQANRDWDVVEKSIVDNVVEFARRTRKDKHNTWPTLSLRGLDLVFKNIRDGYTAQNAVKSVLKGVEEPRGECAEDAFNTLESLI